MAVPALAAEVNRIGGSYCLILPKAELFCDYGVLFLVVFFPLLPLFVHVDGIHASFPQFPTVWLFPWGFVARLEGSFCSSFVSLGLLTRCSVRGRPLRWLQAHSTPCSAQVTVHSQQRATTFGCAYTGTCETF